MLTQIMSSGLQNSYTTVWKNRLYCFFFVIQCTGQILEAYTENVFVVFTDKTTRMFRIQ